VGISKGVIAYHFDGKDELVKEVVTGTLALARNYIGARVSAAPTGREMLRAYIESNLMLMAEHRNRMIAIAEIARGARSARGQGLFGSSALEAGTAALTQLLARFQAAGEFRADFDPR
jgi:AcrR family transcriptional regulator